MAESQNKQDNNSRNKPYITISNYHEKCQLVQPTLAPPQMSGKLHQWSLNNYGPATANKHIVTLSNCKIVKKGMANTRDGKHKNIVFILKCINKISMENDINEVTTYEILFCGV